MTNTEIKIRLEKILVRNEQRKANKLIPADILDIKDIIKQLSICDVVGRSEQLKCYHQYMNAGTLQGEAMKKCLKYGEYVKAL